VVGGLAALVGALAVGWMLFVPVADWLATHDVGHVTGSLRTLRLQAARDVARGRLLTLGAGLFAAGALIFTARNTTLSRRTLELAEQGQVTDRYTKAIEQLGSNTIDITIGGIYALERIARDSPRDHRTIMEVLAAYIREHSREQWPISGEESGAELPERTTRPDVQAAVTVIGRRDITHDSGQIDLANVNLSGADLRGAELAHANLIRANLTRVSAAQTNLADANLPGANLTEVDLSGANLSGANLPGANLPRAFMPGADLHGAHLQRADLTSATLTAAVLTGAHLRGTNLTDANLTSADLALADLVSANLTRANLADANLTGADLTNADLLHANVEGTCLTDTNLTGASFPPVAPVPEGWVFRPRSGRLARADDGPGSA
jgi:uncharacterized protein YjbI with pentapeptide repeats